LRAARPPLQKNHALHADQAFEERRVRRKLSASSRWGRMTPEELDYLSSWIEFGFQFCWQIMQTADFAMFDK
jgi:hypothetical protein